MTPRGGARPGSGRKPSGKPTREVVAVTLPPDLATWAADEAGARGLSRSELVTQALEAIRTGAPADQAPEIQKSVMATADARQDPAKLRELEAGLRAALVPYEAEPATLTTAADIEALRKRLAEAESDAERFGRRLADVTEERNELRDQIAALMGDTAEPDHRMSKEALAELEAAYRHRSALADVEARGALTVGTLTGFAKALEQARNLPPEMRDQVLAICERVLNATEQIRAAVTPASNPKVVSIQGREVRNG